MKISVLNNKQISQCFDLYEDSPATLPKTDFYTSNWVDDSLYKQQLHEKIGDIIGDTLSRLLVNYRCIYRYFLVKNPGPKSEFKLHQDWTLVDESKWVGLTAWIPLIDTATLNGTFQVIPRSHRFMTNIRGRNICAPYLEIRDSLEQKYGLPIRCKAGEAIIFNHRLMHFSAANKSKVPRVAVGAAFVPCKAPVLQYWKSGTGELRCARVSDDFLIKDHIGDDELSRLINGEQQEAMNENTIDLKEFHDNFVKVNSWSMYRLKFKLSQIGVFST